MTMTEATPSTTTVTVEIAAGELHQALANARLFVAPAERPVIHAVRIDLTADGDMVLEATDSYTLYRQTVPTTARGPLVAQLDADDLDVIVKGIKPSRVMASKPVMLDFTPTALTVRFGGFTYEAKLMDPATWGWPNTASLWPVTTAGLDAGAAVGIDPAKLARIAKVKADYTGAIAFYVDGPLKPLRVTVGERITLLQMPVRL